MYSEPGTAPATLSVITVVYNGAAGIARTIASVLAQTYRPIEYIVIDGQSSDGTVDIIRQFGNAIQIVRSEPDGGIYDAMNKGLRLASGQYLLFMNCGDVFANPNAAASAMRDVASSGEQVIFGRWLRQREGKSDVACQPQLDKGLFNHQAVIYSRSIHAWHGEYLNIKGLTAADYLFFAPLFNSKSIRCICTDVTIAAVDVGGVSSGTQTLSQKYAVDFLCQRTSRTMLIGVIGLHPVYRTLKRWLGISR